MLSTKANKKLRKLSFFVNIASKNMELYRYKLTELNTNLAGERTLKTMPLCTTYMRVDPEVMSL